MASGCNVTTDLVSWERIAREDELPDDMPPLAPGDTVKLLVLACQDHAIPEELRVSGVVHQSTCTAPPTCDCTPSTP
jgi:hypothetical protein